MARALVIKGSNFSANKVTTVSINGGTPCTGIEFAESTITIIGTEAVAVGYTLTPSNTTDVVTWESSNTDVITVDNGVITPVGVGTCTLKAICNGHIATATVTVQIFYENNWIFASALKSDTNGYVYASANAYQFLTATANEAQATEHVIFGSFVTLPKCIKLPKNTAMVKVSITDTSKFANETKSKIVWAKDESAGYQQYPNAIKAISESTEYNIRTNATKSFDVPEGVDSLTFTTKLQTTHTSSDNPNDVASSGGLVIEFLAE